jgi:hypothetical protein
MASAVFSERYPAQEQRDVLRDGLLVMERVPTCRSWAPPRQRRRHSDTNADLSKNRSELVATEKGPFLITGDTLTELPHVGFVDGCLVWMRSALVLAVGSCVVEAAVGTRKRTVLSSDRRNKLRQTFLTRSHSEARPFNLLLWTCLPRLGAIRDTREKVSAVTPAREGRCSWCGSRPLYCESELKESSSERARCYKRV